MTHTISLFVGFDVRRTDPAASNAMSVFRTNPLEVFEIEARISRYYDHWVRLVARLSSRK